MTPQTFATVLARFAGLWLLLSALMQLPTFFNAVASRPLRPHFASFESRISTNDPFYESKQRALESSKKASEGAEALSRRLSFGLYFSLGIHIAGGLLFIFYSREIGDLVCRGIERKS